MKETGIEQIPRTLKPKYLYFKFKRFFFFGLVVLLLLPHILTERLSVSHFKSYQVFNSGKVALHLKFELIQVQHLLTNTSSSI